MRVFALLLVTAALSLSGPAVASAAQSAPSATDGAQTAQKKKAKKRNARRGGRVRAAWPRSKRARAPRNQLARWLAKQVGSVKVKRRKRAGAAQTGSGSGTTTGLSGSAGQLWLLRSFEIPKTDAAYDRLANYSWTYDNALAAFAFMSVGLKSGSEQLLDQLKALQRADGSIEFAFDTRTGAAAPYYRSGALAWVGLAAAAYRRKYDSDRYDALIGGVVRYLLGLRNSAGLIRGGPDVTWVSTQHNLLTIGFLRDLVDQMSSRATFGGFSRSDLDRIQTTMGTAVLSNLLVQESSTSAYFKQGIDDAQIPLDVQALGAIYLKLRGDARANHVANAITSKFYVPARNSLSGYRPFSGTGAPDVIWSEGTIEASLAFSRLGISNSAADAAVASIAATVKGSTAGPVGADRDVVSPVWGEYHTWPASAAASWLLIRVSSQQLLFAE
jgi:hypothetical protein